MATERLRTFSDGTDGQPAMPGSSPLLPNAAAPLPMLTASMAPPPVAAPAPAAPSLMGGLRNVYGGGNSFGDAASPDFSQAMTGNPALLAANTAPAPAVAPAAPTLAKPFAPSPAGAGRGFVNPPVADPTAPAPTVAPAPLGAGNVTSLGGFSAPPGERVAQLNRDAQASRDLASRSIELANQGVGQATPGLAVIDNGGPNRNADFNLQADLRNALNRTTTTRRGTTVDPAAEVLAGQVKDRAQSQTRLREMSLQNEGRGAEARMRDATDRRGQDITSEDRRYTSDQNLRGNLLQAGTASAKLAQEAKQADRQYGLDVAKVGADQANKNYEVRRQATTDITNQITSMIPPGADGKPDAAGAARYISGLNAQVAQRTQALQAQVAKGGPNAAGAKAELDALESRGLAAMDPVAVRQFIVGQRLADQTGQQGDKSWFNGTIGTDAANSTAPITSLKPERGWFGTDYKTNRGDVIPARNLKNDQGKLNQDLNVLIQR